MPRITDITAQKRNQDIYNVFVDGKFICGLGSLELSSAGIKLGLELSDDEIVALVARSQGSKAFNAALRYLSYRPRSEYEVADYLRRKEYDPELVEETLSRLRQNRFLDDTAFADSWIRSRQATKPRSMRVLRLELAKKRVPREIIDEVLDGQDSENELTALRAVAANKLKLTRFSADKQKLTQYLLGQGYRYGDVKVALSDLTTEDKEFNNSSNNS